MNTPPSITSPPSIRDTRVASHSDLLSGLLHMFGTLSEERVDTLVNMIESEKEVILSTVKSGKKDVLVKPKEIVNIPCRINTGYVERNIPVLLEKLSDGYFPFELELCDSLITLKRGNCARINVMCINNSYHDVIVPNRTMLGKLTQVRSATPFQVKFNDDSSKEKVQHSRDTALENNGLLSNVARLGVPQINLSEKIPEVKLPDGLSPEPKEIILNMLKEERGAFCTSEGDVGCAEELHMKINLSDDRPVVKNYVGVPKPLYPELKAYVEDLLNRGFITKSCSPYSSACVVVRKKDGSMRLCIDYRELKQGDRVLVKSLLVGQYSDISLVLAMLEDSKLLLILSRTFKEHVKEPMEMGQETVSKVQENIL